MQEFLSDASIVAALDIESGIVFFDPLILLLASCFQLCETSPSLTNKEFGLTLWPCLLHVGVALLIVDYKIL